jgi:hypothetical protein
MKKPTPCTQVGKLMKRATTICISAFLLVGYICASSGISAQSDQPARAKVHLQEHIPPGNYWRQEAVNVATQADTVPPDIRKIRDSYWNLLFPKPKGPFGVSIIDGGSIYSGSQKPSNEFPGVRKHPWFIGRFESFHVYQTSGGGGIYTEMNFRVQHVFINQRPTGLTEGQLIDVAIPGGAIIDNQGHRVDFFNKEVTTRPQPGHVYLMDLFPCKALHNCAGGDFYLPGVEYDITGDTVKPLNDVDSVYAETGKSKLAGTPSSTIISRWEQILADHAQDEVK